MPQSLETACSSTPQVGSEAFVFFVHKSNPINSLTSQQVCMIYSGQIADYKSKTGSVGFSYRFYVEGIIQNPDIKMIAIDGGSPTGENVRNGSCPIVALICPVTWRGNPNENVDTLLDWI